MTDQSLRESIKEIIRKDFKETVDKAVEQHGERIVEFAEQSKAIHEQSVDAIIACFKEEGFVQLAYNPIKQEVNGKPIADILVTTSETKKRKCSDVHPDLQTDAHGGFHED